MTTVSMCSLTGDQKVRKDSRSIQELAREAVVIQDACNPAGIALAYANAVQDLMTISPELDTDSLRNHPIVRMWASKIYTLAGLDISDVNSYENAYLWCIKHSDLRGLNRTTKEPK